MTSWSVPWRPGSGVADRGKSSYHAPKRARSRSTVTGSSRPCRPAWLQSGWRPARSARAGSSARFGARLGGPGGGAPPPRRDARRRAPRRLPLRAPPPARRAPLRQQIDRLRGRPPRTSGRGRAATCRTVDPRLDGVPVRLQGGHPERAAPPVVTIGSISVSSSRVPPRAGGGARRDGVVPLGEGVGLDHDPLAHGALDREAPAVHLGRDVLDDHARRAPGGRGGIGRTTLALASPPGTIG